ncbi:MAG: TIGR02710 family CRISPR-associated protein [Desulfovibrionaceae bacterium]|nr:TIGR02710 family CRISPR-associated protein [Desulfovibrionaceae bacterium]
MSSSSDLKVMVCTVGGTPDPLRTSICHHKPTHVIYVASPNSRSTIRKDIEPDLPWQISDTQTVTLSDYQDIVQCVQDMRQGISRALKDMSLPENTPIIADITGGTKIMSAALTLVMMEFNSRFSYIGGNFRTKGGLGVVEPGQEVVIQDANPWVVLALREVQSLARSFNQAQFADALSTAKNLNQKLEDPSQQKFYGAVADLIHAYMLWDSFDHNNALMKLRQAITRLSPYAAKGSRLETFLSTLEQNKEQLNAINEDAKALQAKNPPQNQDIGQVYLLDLLSNAKRRAQAEHFDDAVARLYSAIEKSAKMALWSRHNIDNSHITLDQLPESLKESWQPIFNDQGEAKVGLQKSFELLAALNDPLKETFLKRQQELDRGLESRNKSLLAHGYLPIDKDKYQKMFNIALEFLRIEEKSLNTFPQIDWKALIL